jgi:hypothetical protein
MTVFGSAVEVVEQYVAEIRPCSGAPRHPAMFLTERGTPSRAVSLKRDSLPLPPQSERADGGAVAPARDEKRTFASHGEHEARLRI